MPSSKPFVITMGDVNYLLDQLRDAIKIVRFDANGQPIYGYVDSAGVSHDLGLFGTFDPLAVTDAVTGLSIYDGAREASGFRLPTGFFNNLVSVTSWTWGATNDPFPRLTAADYNHYVEQSLTNPALATYGAAHPSFVPVADNSTNYADLNKTVVDYTPRMITQTISSSYGDHATGVAESALTRMDVATDTITEVVTARDGTTSTQTETIVRNVNTLPGDPSTSGIFTLFGQFFDHGLDFIDKGGQGSKIVIPLAPDDPLYRAPSGQDPGNTTITISRATPDGYTVTDQHGRPVSIAGPDGLWGTSDDVKAPGGDGVYGTADDVHGAMVKPTTTSYTNHTSPYIDQSQSYGSNTQTTNLLREWVQDPNTGVYRPGAELLDGHRTQAYNSQVFDDASPTGLGVGTTTRTVPTLNEMREHIRETGRADLTWDDINNLRARDDHGQVVDTNGAAVGGFVYTGEALLLDMNPRFDTARLQPNDGNAATVWDTNEAAKVTTAIAYMNSHMADVGRSGDVLGFAIDPQTGLNALQLTLGSSLNMGPGSTLPAGTVLHGAFALAPWVNFSNFSITVTDQGFYGAVGEIMMASVGDHYIAGDGRANENFGLTALHHVFHENHNVQLVNLENMILTSPDATARHGYQLGVDDGHGGFFHDQAGNYTLTDQSGVAVASIDKVSWDPDKMFETVKLINEMEYQHTAIDQYARLVTPDLPEFVTYDSDINADISLEYSQAAFRFGHSQLRETIDSIDPSGMVTKFALEGAFLNPEQFAAVGASNILRGMSQQVSNEVDEFVTPAMQQTLLGQALDLGAINIARGRDVGMPTLNEVRKQLHDALVAERAADPNTPHHSNLIVDALNPYTSWAEYGSQMQHPESLVDFIAAYAFDGDLTKAQELIDIESGVIVSGSGAHGYTIDDAIGFLNNNYTGPNAELATGEGAFNNIDFWIGGLAELHVFTGQLGTTFNAIFEDQMERLMDGDRFYYIYRLQDSLNIDTDLGHAIVTEQFKDIIERTTGVMHLNGDVMGYSDSTLELARKVMPGTALTAVRGQDILDITGNHVMANQGDLQYDLGHNLIMQDYKTAHAYGDVLAANDANGIHMGIYSGVGGGTAGNGTVLHKSNTDLGFVNQAYIADFRPDLGENPDGTPASGYNSHETLAGTDYNDWIDAGNGDDTVYGDKGDDVLDGKAGADHLYGGDGQDVLYGGDIEDFLDGGEGDDIIYAGTSAGALDVVIGGGGNDKLYGEAGIDEIYGGSGDDYIDAGGDTDLAFGDSGNDIMFGGDGPDELRGGLGDDMLSGGSGADVLKGEGGDDLLFGGIGQNALNGDSDELLGDVGFDMSVFSDTNIVLDAAADLRNQNLVAAGGAAPYNPFSQLWADLEGVVGSKFADRIIGDDGDNWLIGGGGNDTFGTTLANTDGLVGSGGNDVIIGGHIRLDTLIGTYGGYTDGFDANGNATHSVTGTLTGGLLANSGAGIHTELFAKHYTDLLMSERNKDLVLGKDSGADGTSDTVILSGNRLDYSIAAINYASAHEGAVVAYKITDHGGLNPDGSARAPSDGTDLLIGIHKLQFADGTVDVDQLVNIPATGAPVISDATPTEGQQLTLDISSIQDGNGFNPAALHYQWQSSPNGTAWNDIAGATNAAFTPQDVSILGFNGLDAQAGLQLRVVATFTDAGGHPETVISNPTGPVGANWSSPIQATFNGTAGNDIANGSNTIFGFGGADTLNGNAGDDILNGNGGNDTINGGAGNDTINGGAQTDTAVYAGPVANFTLAATTAAITVTDNTGAEGTDTVSGTEQLRFNGVNYGVVTGTNANNANLNGAAGTTGSQAIFGLDGNDTMNGGAGDDYINGGSGADTVTQTGSTGGHDFVDGGTTALDINGRDTTPDTYVLNGVAGAETFSIYSNTDDWDGAGSGTASSAAHFGFTGLNANTEIVVARNGVVIAELDNIEEIVINAATVTSPGGVPPGGTGTIGGDTVQVVGNFTGTSLNYSTITVNGGAAADTVDISGLTSDHRIVFHGGGGDDQVVGTLRPQDVVDTQTAQPPGDQGGGQGGSGGDGQDGNSGGDDQHCSSGDHQHDGQGDPDTPQPPAVNPGMAEGQIGTAAADVMVGTTGDDVLSGLDGDDVILGNDGADTLKAGAGDDLVKAGAGDDVVFGNDGNDDLFGGAGRDLITGDGGDDRLFGDAGDDALEGGAGNDTVYGGAGNDRIIATVGDGNDTYFGDTEEDTLDYSAISANITADLGNGIGQHGSVASAQSGTDQIFGFEDFIGGSGNDTIVASSVANVMDGGAGNDTYVFGSAADANGDTIKGFQPGDKIDLSAIDANTGAAGNQSFVLFAGNVFTSAGQVIVTQEVKDGAEHTFVSGNTNGDTAADFKIDLGAGNHALTTADFNGVH
ncbi:peroxidase family protein [Bradyrhizobium sp. 76]|uniref:peroxidase family protein n=1 Tax=Bradyrhizobium sp. 76 TaxID=2782680 RepID=UPI001FF84C54|nr:peroxidase family protein [Bradyrhizobium sp. 76]MCK1404900.1 calcium-binding protein [Bradyrhizobium sp. 76]